MNKKLQKTLLLGVALLMGLPAQGMKPGDGVGAVNQALTVRIIGGIVSLLPAIEEFGPRTWDPNAANTEVNDAVEIADLGNPAHAVDDSNNVGQNRTLTDQTNLSSEEQIRLNNELLQVVTTVNLEAIQTLISAGANVCHRNIRSRNDLIDHPDLAVNQQLKLVIWLLGYNVAGINWVQSFKGEAIAAFLIPPNAEAIAPIVEWVNRVMRNNASHDVRQALFRGLAAFLQAIRNRLVVDRDTHQAVVVEEQEQALIERLLYVRSSTKSSRNVVEFQED